jgi:predicted 2-oxoglutarate/Fe(II)-dependent dioxygenase YbiX
MLSVYADRTAIPRSVCQEIVREMRACRANPALIERDGVKDIADRNVRSAGIIQVSAATAERAQARLLGLRPVLERHFQLELPTCDAPEFLRYQQGDFFEAHQDGLRPDEVSGSGKNRRVTVICFLNSSSPEAAIDTYSGGELILYGLLQDPRAAKLGIPVSGEAGLLIAFPSHTFHEVKPVTRGERFTLVSWYS